MATQPIFEKILELQRNGEEGVLITVVEKEGSGPAGPGARMLVLADGKTAGTIGGGSLELVATRKALRLLETKGTLLERYTLSEQDRVVDAETPDMVCGGRVTLFYEVLSSGPRIYIFGGGHVGQALVYHLRHLPYHVTVIDPRPDMVPALQGADSIVTAEYEKALEDRAIPRGGYVVIATPSHEADYAILRHIFTSGWEPRYVGLLASKRKSATFIRNLKEELGTGIDLSPLHTPAGLDIGGDSVHEIAVSIIAEIQALRYDRNQQASLRDSAFQTE